MYIAKLNKTYDNFLGKWSSLYNYEGHPISSDNYPIKQNPLL